MEVPKVKDWLLPPRKHVGHGVLARAHLPLSSPRTHQVDNGDAEQAAYSQDGQGQPQQGVRLHPLRDGTERRPSWAAPLWNHRVQSPGSSPRQGGAHAGGPGWGWGAHSPRAPQTGQLLPGSSSLLGSWRVLCPELRTRCSDKRNTPTLGATCSRSHLGAPGRPGEAEVSGEASGAPRWAKLSRLGPRGRGKGAVPPWPQPPMGTAHTHQELISKAQAQHQPQHAGHEPEGHSQSRRPGEKGKHLSSGGLSARGCATDMLSQHPNSQAHGHLLPLTPETAILHSAEGLRGGSLKTVVQLPHQQHTRPGQNMKPKVNIMSPFLGQAFKK